MGDNVMAKYLVSFTLEKWYEVEIEAESEGMARNKFHMGYWNWEDAVLTGEETQDSIEVEAI